MSGFLECDPNIKLPGNNLNSSMCGIPDIVNCQVISCTYQLPQFNPHITKLLNNITLPKSILTQKDFEHIKYQRRFGKPKKKLLIKDLKYKYNKY
jgi:hypothetical protein